MMYKGRQNIEIEIKPRVKWKPNEYVNEKKLRTTM